MLLPIPGDKHAGLGTRQSDKEAAVRGEDTGGVVPNIQTILCRSFRERVVDHKQSRLLEEASRTTRPGLLALPGLRASESEAESEASWVPWASWIFQARRGAQLFLN